MALSEQCIWVTACSHCASEGLKEEEWKRKEQDADLRSWAGRYYVGHWLLSGYPHPETRKENSQCCESPVPLSDEVAPVYFLPTLSSAGVTRITKAH